MAGLADIEERDNELYEAYKAAFRKRGMTHQKAIHAAINSQASRFWVSPCYIYRDILARIRGYAGAGDPSSRRKHGCRKIREDLYDELYRAYLRLAESRYFKGCSPLFIVSFVVNRPAPKYYISYVRARNIIARKRREERRVR